MWSIVANKPHGVKRFVADELSDLKKISISDCSQGSTVFVIKESKTYIMAGNKKWEVVSTSKNSSNSDSGQTSEDSGSDNPGASSEYTIIDGGTAAGYDEP